MTLGQSDGIKLTDNTDDWERLGLNKIKNMVANAETYMPDPIVEAPVNPVTDSAANSQAPTASSEATVASSAAEAPVSSVADSAVAQ